MKNRKSQRKPKQLTAKQELFCIEYLKDFNATQAAIRAKYNKNSAYSMGQRLLKNVEVQKKVKLFSSEAVNKSKVDLERVIHELSLIAFSDITNYAEIENGKVTLKNSAGMSRELTAAIESVSQVGVRAKSIKFKLHDKARALETLLKYFVENPASEEQKKIITSPLKVGKP